MKIFVTSADNNGRLDGSTHAHLLNHLPNVVTSPAAADVAIVVVSFFHDYNFNPKLHDLTIPTVIIDMIEMEWCFFDEKNETHLFGKNTRANRWLNPNWYPFCDWVRDHPPLLYLKRELLAKNQSDTVKPIEWPCYLPDMPMQSEQEFNRRPLEVFYNWGFSNPMRPKLQGDIFHAMNAGIGIISEAGQFEGFMRDNPKVRTWMAVFAPWYSRVPISDLLFFQRRAKLSVALWGCGKKCFRMAESPCESIMALPSDDLAWSYPWVHGENCIRLWPDHLFEDLDAATKRPDLYEIYKRSQETIARYRGPAYVRDYILPTIEGLVSPASDANRND